MWQSILLAIIGAIIAAYSQILLKKSTYRKYNSKIKEYINQYVVTGYILLGISTICTIISYVYIDYMLGNIVNSLSYILVVFFAYYFFDEQFNKNKVIGIICILLGILFYNLNFLK